MRNLQALGQAGESVVVRHLEESGAMIIDRNWRVKTGEIDIVAFSNNTFIFVEVKTRTSTSFGTPFDAITPDKAFRLQRLALAWLATHAAWGRDYRIDCAGVIASSSNLEEATYSLEYREAVL